MAVTTPERSENWSEHAGHEIRTRTREKPRRSLFSVNGQFLRMRFRERACLDTTDLKRKGEKKNSTFISTGHLSRSDNEN